ncbi:MAG: YobA family protein [Bacillaceae bacterium]|nr:YobA family protein [Bacillaceae bacterium]
MKKLLLFCSMFFMVGLLFGCNTTANEPEGKIGIRGTVTDISIDGEYGSILVEGEIKEDTDYDKASVRVTKDTLIQKDALSKLFVFKDIQVGDFVEVIFDGPVAESYPVQGTAGVVRIITEKK